MKLTVLILCTIAAVSLYYAAVFNEKVNKIDCTDVGEKLDTPTYFINGHCLVKGYGINN